MGKWFKSISTEEIKLIEEKHRNGLAIKVIAFDLGLNKSTVSRYIAALGPSSSRRVCTDFSPEGPTVARIAGLHKKAFVQPALGRPSWFNENLNLRARR